MTTLTLTVKEQCKRAHAASRYMNRLSTDQKNHALQQMAKGLRDAISIILEANQKDISNGKNNDLTNALIDRLTLTETRLEDIATTIESISHLNDPIGETLSEWTQKDGLNIKKIRVPMGVIGMIYEARPNVTADAISLAIKTSNCIVLRGSSSAYHSNKAITDTLKVAAKSAGIPEDAIQLLEDTSRESVSTFVQMKDYLNLIIPRGGAGLIQRVCESATVPTIETGVGNCHVYVDKDANLDTAHDIILNSKLHRPSVCNAAESMLIHHDISSVFLPKVLQSLSDQNVEIRGCETTCKLFNTAKQATSEDWATEYLGLTVSVKVVPSLEDAIQHIHEHGSMHTEVIVSENRTAVSQFQQEIDASTVISNASSRFTDGGEFGFGAEIGISTQKLHARGPMGLPEITSYKYIVSGDGQIRT
jgi:glutamate-5-semialdehyde dehydrogenase